MLAVPPDIDAIFAGVLVVGGFESNEVAGQGRDRSRNAGHPLSGLFVAGRRNRYHVCVRAQRSNRVRLHDALEAAFADEAVAKCLDAASLQDRLNLCLADLAVRFP